MVRDLDGLEVQLCKAREINVRIGKHVSFSRIGTVFHGHEIPEQVVNDESPRQKMVNGEAFCKLALRVDVSEIGELLDPLKAASLETPEIARSSELSQCWRVQFVQNAWQIRISRLQVHRKVMLGEGFDDGEILVQERAP